VALLFTLNLGYSTAQFDTTFYASTNGSTPTSSNSCTSPQSPCELNWLLGQTWAKPVFRLYFVLQPGYYKVSQAWSYESTRSDMLIFVGSGVTATTLDFGHQSSLFWQTTDSTTIAFRNLTLTHLNGPTFKADYIRIDGIGLHDSLTSGSSTGSAVFTCITTCSFERSIFSNISGASPVFDAGTGFYVTSVIGTSISAPFVNNQGDPTKAEPGDLTLVTYSSFTNSGSNTSSFIRSTNTGINLYTLTFENFTGTRWYLHAKSKVKLFAQLNKLIKVRLRITIVYGIF